MSVVRLDADQEERALPIILRHSPGLIFGRHTYLLAQEVVQRLRSEGIVFDESAELVLRDFTEVPCKEFDIFAPLFHQVGRPTSPGTFRDLQERLLREFRRVEFFPQPNKGSWKMAGVLFQDEVVVYRVVAGSRKKATGFVSHLKEWMQQVFEQEDILIIEREVGRAA